MFTVVDLLIGNLFYDVVRLVQGQSFFLWRVQRRWLCGGSILGFQCGERRFGPKFYEEKGHIDPKEQEEVDDAENTDSSNVTVKLYTDFGSESKERQQYTPGGAIEDNTKHVHSFFLPW